MKIPHTFPSLLQSSGCRPVLLIGAGMSNGLAPPVKDLTNEIRAQNDAINYKHGINISPPHGDEFYDWAEEAFNALKNAYQLSDDFAKLRLAEAMGIASNPRFFAKVDMPLRGNTPRHRVIARFAREGCWSTICSLNWDCILETALESAGLNPHPNPQQQQTKTLPWQRWYCTWQAGDQHIPTAMQGDTVHLIKPHGCVNKLATGDASSFIVTRSEIRNLPKKLGLIVNGRMNMMFSDAPLIAAGWRAEEEYILLNIENIKHQGTLLPHGTDKLSIINRSWYPQNPTVTPEKHDRVAIAFESNQAMSHFPTGSTGEPTIDELFQWLQTRYGLEILGKFSKANGQNIPAWNAKDNNLLSIKNQFQEPRPTDWLNSFFDNFLSVWVRFCCNAGKVVYKENGVPIQPDIIATHRRDDHIPWEYGNSGREDLLAVIPLILALRGAPPTGTTTKWNFDEFPGALWDETDGHLVLPLSAWDENNNPLALAALKPLIEDRSWSRKGIIQKFSILPLLPLPDYPPVNDDSLKFRSSIAWLMKSSKFSDPNKIGVVTLADI